MATGTVRTRRVRALAPFVAVVSLVALSVANGQPATADPRATLEQVQAQVEALQNDAANANELVNDAENRLAAVQAKVAALKVKLAAAQVAVGTAAESVDALARSAYTSGGTSTMMQAMLADDPQQFLERAASLDAVSRIGSADLRRSQAARVALAQVKTELAQQEAQATAVAKEAADHRAEVNAKLDQATSLLSQLREEERQRLAAIAEQRRQQAIAAAAAAARQQEADARAAAAARASRSDTGGGNGGGNSGGGTSGGSGGGGGGGYSGDPSARAQVAVRYALSQVGDPYSYSANPPNSWDCSKLTAAAWRAAGVSLTAYSYAQYQQTRRIDRSELRPGDLLFYFRSGAHHVAMYIGGGRIVHAANPSRGVEITSAWGPWYGEHYSGAGRVA